MVPPHQRGQQACPWTIHPQLRDEGGQGPPCWPCTRQASQHRYTGLRWPAHRSDRSFRGSLQPTGIAADPDSKLIGHQSCNRHPHTDLLASLLAVTKYRKE